MNIFNEERRAYYQAKKRELARQKDVDKVIKQDALFIRHYGMIAFLELFPEAKWFGTSWHEKVIVELQEIEKAQMAQLLSGIFSASAATKDKKAFRKFKSIIRSMTKR